MKKVSVIIPCYNAVKFIDRCMNSLLSQTIGTDQLELIVINDGSTDDTYTELCRWEQRYPEQMLVINCEQNGRQGTARNIGLDYASGQYIAYMDVDDYIEPDMYEKMYDKALEYDCDMVVIRSKAYQEYKFGTISLGRTGKENSFLEIRSKDDREYLLDMNIGDGPCNKLIRASVLKDNDIRFPEKLYYEDLCFTELLKHYVNSLYIIEEYLYHHIIQSNSAAFHTANPDRYLDYLDSFTVEEVLLTELKERGIYQEFQVRYERDFILNGYVALLRFYLRTGQQFPYDSFSYIRRRTLELYPEYKKNPYISMILAGKAGRTLQILCESLEQELTPKSVLELGMAVLSSAGS